MSFRFLVQLQYIGEYYRVIGGTKCVSFWFLVQIQYGAGRPSLSCLPVIRATAGNRPHGDGLLVAGLFFTNYPPSWEKIPLLRTRGYVTLRGSRGGSVGSVFHCEPMCCRFESLRG